MKWNITIVFSNGMASTCSNFRGTREEAWEFAYTSKDQGSSHEVINVTVIEAKHYEEEN